MSEIVARARVLVFNIAALGFVLLAARAIWNAEPGVALVAVGAMVVCAMIANLEHFADVSIGLQGVTARTRQVIEEASTTIDEVRRLAIELGGMIVQLIHESGRWQTENSSADDDDSEERVIAALRSLRVSDEEIASVRARAAHIHKVDYLQHVSRRFTHRSGERATAWRTLRSDEGWEFPTAAEIETFYENHGFQIDEYEREWLRDYEHFYSTGTHRRPAEWRRRGYQRQLD
jgi:hypothetical protein